jgi:hypothetical protein
MKFYKEKINQLLDLIFYTLSIILLITKFFKSIFICQNFLKILNIKTPKSFKIMKFYKEKINQLLGLNFYTNF